ncbi:hypothetical protein DCAR_0100429 [Daucus carota subsp. sativus]|uniref:Oleosin n=1 Tax=Daucus carota subsp. sativus TaxID=79200 RepID=A0AAF1AFH1_DAUCS|nr:hypothetical protein DCAR_0100429 [Daucus carota subsp. sativus]
MAHHRHHHHHQQSHKVVKATTALTLTGSLLVLSALTLSATIIGLVLATPVFVIFSPVLVPAAITIFLLAAGVFTAGGLGITATFVFSWMYNNLLSSTRACITSLPSDTSHPMHHFFTLYIHHLSHNKYSSLSSAFYKFIYTLHL